ncbi:MAG: type II toxin-antitoxin system RelB/DinJ family antitoxin [Spirochaetaceae bacterium]|jgi:DNA-damage-inducible protein J|nr:type II toxin-antitoxin system RelB/DinJ family antitoxin [Spirochaetaceae bacterium]
MTQVNFRIDDEIKNNAENALKDMGLTMSSAITMFLVKVGRERRIPFEITANDPFYSSENMERLKRSAAQMEQTGGTIHKIGALADND